MSRYDDILKRNEQLIDNVYEMNEEITDLAYENEELTKENEELSVDNEELFEENASMKKGIAELHKSSARRFRSNRPRTQKMYYEEPKEEVQQNVQHRKDCNCNQVVHNDSQHRVISLFVSEHLAPMESVISTATHFVLKRYKYDGVVCCKPEKDEREVISL